MAEQVTATKRRTGGSPTAFLRTRRTTNEAMPRFLFSARLEGQEFAETILEEFRKELKAVQLKPRRAKSSRAARPASRTST